MTTTTKRKRTTKRQPPPSEQPLRLEWVEAGTLTAHPDNWRRHPEPQKRAIKAAIDRVGWAGALLYNEGTERLLDGHARLELAEDTDLVPVLIGSWDASDEAAVMTTLDPITAMADTDLEPAKLAALLERADIQGDLAAATEDLEAIVEQLNTPPEPSPEPDPDRQAEPADYVFSVVVTCRDRDHQRSILRQLHAEGLDCEARID